VHARCLRGVSPRLDGGAVIAIAAAPALRLQTAGAGAVTCMGQPATIVGTNGPDVIPQNDYLDGGERGYCDRDVNTGRDRLFGDSGDDTLWAADFGQVVALGRTGSDEIHGLRGAGDLEGDGGDDLVTGGRSSRLHRWGRTRLLQPCGEHRQRHAGRRARNDTIWAADFGTATAYGGAGDDMVFGLEGADTLTGGSGSDLVTGGENDDTLHLTDGVSGNDTGDGGDGFDTCDADPGDTLANCEA
jgi:hemolysin type calcium-binding protein